MKHKIERSLSQVLFKYMIHSYADFDIKGEPITSRVVGWNDYIDSSQNKSRILNELLLKLTIFNSEYEQYDINKFLKELDQRGIDCFDVRILKPTPDDDKKHVDIVTVLRPYVFYCKSCGLVHVITDYKNSKYKDYKAFIGEKFNSEKHRCVDCNGILKQQSIIRVSSKGDAFDYEPICEKHKYGTKYYIKQGEPRDYFCESCGRVIQRPFKQREDLTPALDPRVFFTQFITIVDLKEDEKVKLLGEIGMLPKLLVLSEFGVIDDKEYDKYSSTLVDLHTNQVSSRSIDYVRKTSNIRQLLKQLNEPNFETFNDYKTSVFYETIGVKLLELKEIKARTTMTYSEILKENTEKSRFVSDKDLLLVFRQCLIKDITISEEVPITNIAFGFTRLSDVPDKDTEVQLRLYKDKGTQNYNFYSTNLQSEGVLITLNRELVIEWIKNNLLEENLSDLYVNTNEDYRIDYFNNYIRSEVLHTIYDELLHTLSHVLIKEISNASGIEVTALSEMLFPEVGSIFIYCTSNEGMVLNSVKSAVSNRLYYILLNCINSINQCNLLSICDSKEKQACLGCVIIPELSCRYFNNNLDRKLLNNKHKRIYKIHPNKTIIIKKGMWAKWQK